MRVRVRSRFVRVRVRQHFVRVRVRVRVSRGPVCDRRLRKESAGVQPPD